MPEFDASKAPEEKVSDREIKFYYAIIPEDLMDDMTIPAIAKYLYACLYRRCYGKKDPRDRFTEYSQQFFAEELGYKDARAVRPYLKILKEAGWISIKRRGINKTNKTSVHVTPRRHRKK